MTSLYQTAVGTIWSKPHKDLHMKHFLNRFWNPKNRISSETWGEHHFDTVEELVQLPFVSYYQDMHNFYRFESFGLELRALLGNGHTYSIGTLKKKVVGLYEAAP